ncbi:PD-(D/E)XK nuclease family protein [Brachyspira innocens]|nr:PD-(D/E)XK nuclease family protein [Brachyspira innocens]MDO6994890.1 PD-(D/E)XK nuclease family protein [Brachyspira innocens]
MNTEIIENTLLTLINEFKKDEKEKYNALENTIKSINKSFLEEEELKTNILNKFLPQIKIVIKEVKEEMKKYPPQICIFEAVNLQRHENYNSNLLANFLKINIKYGENTELSFVKDFLLYLHNKFNWDYGLKSIEELEEINHSYINIKREEKADTRRIDLFISYKKEFAIIIENKIYAKEQANQLDDYYKNKKKDNYKNLYMIFLNPSGYESYTLSAESKKELGDNFQTLKHSDIALWLENILENEKYYFLHEKNILFKDNDNKYIRDYRLLKSAMIQTIHNANMISNNTEELDMTREKIQNLLKENIFKDIQTVEDVDEYKKIFNSVIDIINEKEIYIIVKPHIEFTEKVLDYLKNNDKSKSYIYLTERKIIKKIYKEGYSQNIKYRFCNGEVDLILESQRDSFFLHIYLYNLNDNKKYSILIKKLNLEINKIFCKFYEYEHYVYRYDIDTEKDSPEEIADVMIKLYNLLKENL